MDSRQTQVEEAPVRDLHEDDKKIGFALAAGGSALVGVGIAGITSNEAETPEEGLGSVDLTSVGYEGNFVTVEDLPFIGVTFAGAVLIAAGIRKLTRRRS